MEILHIEFVAKLRLCAGAQFLYLERADLVSKRLRRNGDIAVNLGCRIGFTLGRIGHHIIDRFLPAPPFRVNASIDHQPDRAEHLVIQRAVMRNRVFVETHLIAKRLGIQRPTLDIGGVPAKPHKGRQLVILAR